MYGTDISVNFKMVENSFDRVLQNCCFYPTLDKILNSVSQIFPLYNAGCGSIL